MSQRKWNALNRKIADCENCDRLITHCREIGVKKRRAFMDWDYWARPVPNLGDHQAKLLIVGLAPAAHGANRTGRMFTGDRSGDWLFRALYRAGFANQESATDLKDGLKLTDAAITAVCHCAPPDNKPTKEEQELCRPWLEETIDLLSPDVYLALGSLAWNATIDHWKRQGWWSGARPKFGHLASVEDIEQCRTLIGSYHPSQQNTFTGRLTEEMLDKVFAKCRELVS